MALHISDDISISQKTLDKIISDPQATARAVKLIYVNDSQEGIHRIRHGKNFRYQFRNRPLEDKTELQRIRSLVIPPAWENVWICAQDKGHLQVTGIDARKRKQYRYHPLWNQLRNQTKFYRMLQFGNALPAIRKQVQKDLTAPDYSREKVLATVVALMEKTSIRIGSESYEKLYGSFGLTTLKDKHVSFSGNKLRFCFKGKKGVEHTISIQSKKLAKIVKQCRDIPGKELFQYYDADGNRHSIDSGMVNEYLHNIIEGDFTAKDFRTWAGTVQALLAFKEVGLFETQTEAKRKVVEVLDKVSAHLGNTRAVCRKYYVHPSLLNMYENNQLCSYLDNLKTNECNEERVALSSEEKLLMQILAKV